MSKYIVKDDWSGYFDQYSAQNPADVDKGCKKEDSDIVKEKNCDCVDYFDAYPDVQIRKRSVMTNDIFMEREKAEDYLAGQDRIAKQMEDFIAAECPNFVEQEDDEHVSVDVYVQMAPAVEHIDIEVPVEELSTAITEKTVEETETVKEVETEPVVEEISEDVAEVVETPVSVEEKIEEVSEPKEIINFSQVIAALTVYTENVEDVDIVLTNGRTLDDVTDVDVIEITGNPKFDKVVAVIEKYKDDVVKLDIKYKETCDEPIEELAEITERKSKKPAVKKTDAPAKKPVVKKKAAAKKK